MVYAMITAFRQAFEQRLIIPHSQVELHGDE
jgi:hypothetical protein